jgi:hypothetical protein
MSGKITNAGNVRTPVMLSLANRQWVEKEAALTGAKMSAIVNMAVTAWSKRDLK